MRNYQHKLRISFTGIFLFVLITFIQAQGIGSWRNHLAYTNTTQVVETPNKVFALASGDLFSYSPEDDEIKAYSKYDGLNDSRIQFIAYSEYSNSLLLVYENGNMDIFTNAGIYNLPSVMVNTNIQDKTLNRVDVYGRFAYVSAAFGIVKVDMQKRETTSVYTWKNTSSVCVIGDYIYASTNEGIFKALLSKNLSVNENWEVYDPQIQGMDPLKLTAIFLFKGTLIFWDQKNNTIFYKKEDGSSGILIFWGFKRVTVANDYLITVSWNNTFVWTDLNNYMNLEGLSAIDVSCRNNNNIFWIAREKNGLAAVKKEKDSKNYSLYKSDIKINSPYNNHSYRLSFQQNKLLIAGGSAWGDRHFVEGTVMTLENGTWTYVDPDTVNQFMRDRFTPTQIPVREFRDVMDVVVDPRDPSHYFATSYGEGLYEFKDEQPVALYNTTNSILETVLPSKTDPNRNNYIRLAGLAYDSNNNLYICSSSEGGTATMLYILTNDNQWVKVPYWVDQLAALKESIGPLDGMLITSKNHKWIFSKRFNKIYILDDNNTPTNFTDDKTAILGGTIKDQKGESVTFSSFFCIVEDKKGTLWAGTNKGPVLFYNHQNAVKDPSSYYCTRPILPYNDGSDNGYYLLESAQINAIAVDGANRKWLASENSGVFLVSENGMEVLQNFTAENSPLLSNKVTSIAIDPNTGEVYFATDKGLVSYMGDASTGKSDFSEVRAYPNPVRPEYNDVVTVINLVKDSNVKITDLRGNLIYQGTSKGGMFTWNCTDKNGARVKTGVYLVIAANSDGSEGVVTKIMVVK